MEEDYIIDDLINEKPKKKKIKSGKKGNRGELEIVKILNERFSKIISETPGIGSFSRSVGSGNRWGQKVDLSEAAKKVYSGDLTVPTNFLFTIESKNGYDDIDLMSAFSGKCKGLEDFLDQVTNDAERVGRKPLLVWKKTRKPRVAFLRSKDWKKKGSTMFFFKGWVALPLEELLEKTRDDFWFEIN